MRAALAIATVLLIFSGCTMLREAGQVARAISRPPTRQELDTQHKTLSANADAATEKLKAIRAEGREPTEAETNEIVKDILSNKPIETAPVTKGTAPPPDQEISVNLTYAGYSPASKGGRNLDFDFKALWGTYKITKEQISMPARLGQSEARLDLGEARLRVIPKIVSDVRGRYDIELTDRSGALLGRFNIAESGKQVDITQRPSKYEANLVYYHPERRLTAYAIGKPGSLHPQLGVIFVGKGWSYVENAKKPDLSKGYLFPEVDMVVLPKAWLDNNVFAETCNTLKAGTQTAGGICYS